MAGCNDVACRRESMAPGHLWTCPCLPGALARLERKARQQSQTRSRRSQDPLRCSCQNVAGRLVVLHEFVDVYIKLASATMMVSIFPTVQGCQISKMPCCNKGKRKVALEYGCEHV